MGVYELQDIGFFYGAKAVIKDLTLSFDKGHFYGIIGPNGSGKTTLVDLLAGHIKPHHGDVRLNGRALETYTRNSLARRIALVPQEYRINFPYTCGEVVMMGRYPHISRFSRPADEDCSLVKAVLKQTALEDFVDRYVNQLSGGERQRVVFARSLAQDTPIMLLDEATANLDMQHSLMLLNIASARVDEGAMVIAVLQDINLAAMYCDRLVCMQNGGVYTEGPTADVLTAETLRDVFKVNSHVAYSTFSNARQVTFKKDID